MGSEIEEGIWMRQEFAELCNIVADKKIDPSRVLYSAAGEVDIVVVIGIDKKKDLYLASSDNIHTTLNLVERALEDFRKRLYGDLK